MIRHYKLRKIGWRKSKTHQQKYCLTIPSSLVTRFDEGTYFSLSVSGGAIIATSGAHIPHTKEEIDNFKLEELTA